MQEIQCQYSYANCPARVKRNAMQKHLEENKDKHLILLDKYARDLTESVDNLRAELDYYTSTQIDYMDEIPRPYFMRVPSPPPLMPLVQRPSKAVRIIDPATRKEVNINEPMKDQSDTPRQVLQYEMPIELIMTDVHRHKQDDSAWFSEPFSTGIRGYKMCLAVDANSWGRGEHTHVGLSIFMMKGEYDDELSWPFKGEIKVKLINQTSSVHIEKFLVKTDSIHTKGYTELFSRVLEGDRARSGFGLPKFISYEDLHKPVEHKCYLKDDTLVFRIDSAVHMHT